MELLPKLTPTQALLLRAAARCADGRVIPPADPRGGARFKALSGLLLRGWVDADDRGAVRIANPANLGSHPDGGAAPRPRPPHGNFARKDPFRLGRPSFYGWPQ